MSGLRLSAGAVGALGEEAVAPGCPVGESQSRWSKRVDSRAMHDRYHGLVCRIATRAVRGLPANVAIDDAVAAGWLGLLDALGRRSEQMTEEHFIASASYRVRGAILDHLRALDPLSRQMRRCCRQVTRAVEGLTAQLGRVPDQEEVARELGFTLADYQALRGELNFGVINAGDLIDLAEIPSPELLPEAIVAQRRLLGAAAEVTDSLPPRLQLVIKLYYCDELGFREIGVMLGVTESRACQLHGAAIAQLRRELTKAPRVDCRKRRPRRSLHFQHQ